MRPAIEAVRAHRHRRRRGRALLHRRPVRPGRDSSTRSTTTSPSPSGSSRPARTCWRSRTWPGCCARRPPAPWSPRCASGSTCPCTCTPTTPRAASSPPCSPRSTPASTRSTPPPPRWPAPPRSRRSRRWSRRPTTRDRETGLSLAAVNALEPYWEATRRVYAPFESGPALAHRPRLPPRDPRRPALQPAPAGDRARARREVRADRGHVRRRQRHPRQRRQGDPVLEGGRRPRAAPRRRSAPTRRSSPRTRGKFDIPDSVIGFLNGELGDPPGGWPEPFRTKALEGRTWKPPAEDAHRRAGARGCAPSRRGRPSTSCSSPARPRSSPSPRDVRRRVGAADPRLPLRAAPRRGARGRARRRARP